MTGVLQRRPSSERLIRRRLESGATPSVAISHTPWTASYDTTGSLAFPVPGGLEAAVTPGRNPARHVRPPSREVAKPINVAAPSAMRADWNVVTTVLPNEKLSGSTCV
jgi:hypothetical protein